MGTTRRTGARLPLRLDAQKKERDWRDQLAAEISAEIEKRNSADMKNLASLLGMDEPHGGTEE